MKMFPLILVDNFFSLDLFGIRIARKMRFSEKVEKGKFPWVEINKLV